MTLFETMTDISYLDVTSQRIFYFDMELPPEYFGKTEQCGLESTKGR